MPAWLSPFPIPDAVADHLQQAGWTPWLGSVADLPDDGVLLYDTPDRCFGLELDQLLHGYQQLLRVSSGHRLIAIWRLLELDPLAGALETALTLALLNARPELLEAYLDLELKADLLGGDPDVAYRRRLSGSIQADTLVQAWRSVQTDSSAGLKELHSTTKVEQDAREEAELTLLQLHQVQEEQGAVSLADRAGAIELEQLKQQVQEAREEAELTLLQLHQVQEELEHYFLLSRGKDAQLERYNQLQQRSQRLLARLALQSV